MCGGSILSYCPRNPHGHERALKEEEEEEEESIFRHILDEILPKNLRNLFIILRLCT